MQSKLRDGSVMVCGICGSAPKFTAVGENQHRKCTVSLAVGKRENNGQRETIWCNVVAWHDLASLLAMARKRDAVFVIGCLKSREYNGKTYTDLEAEYLSVASVHAAVSDPAQASPLDPNLFDDDDSPL